jgi:transcriptional regulator with XRE-family HTH domain
VTEETKEFLRLMETSGWSQAEVARQLHMTSGGVSQIVNGQVRPSATTLRLFRLIIETRGTPRAEAATKEGGEAAAATIDTLLTRVPARRRAATRAAIQAMIDAASIGDNERVVYETKRPVTRPASPPDATDLYAPSTEIEEAAVLAKSRPLMAKVRELARAAALSESTGEPNVDTSARQPDTRALRNPQKQTPTQAPTSRPSKVA